MPVVVTDVAGEQFDIVDRDRGGLIDRVAENDDVPGLEIG
jgi:hypothetical protein